MPRLNRVLETCVYCDDLIAAESFYVGILGLTRISKTEGRGISFAAGDSILLIFAADATLKGGTLPPHGAEGGAHFAFQINPEEYQPWLKHLQESGVTIEHEHGWDEWLGHARSMYFRDPGGNLVELITRPAWERYLESSPRHA